MSILIKGMEMPTSCDDCRFHDGWCLLLPGIVQAENERREDCPLVPVPPHGGLIDADALKSNKYEFDGLTKNFYINKKQIDSAPTIIEAEEGE